MKIILTYFEPFGKRTINVSDFLTSKLNYPRFKLRVGFNEVKEDLAKVFKEKPDLLLLFGEAGSYEKITVEKCAHNLANGLDNYGVNKVDEKISEGLDELITPLDLSHAHFHIGLNAGKYLCNYAYYLALSKGMNAIFIHLPYLDVIPADKMLKEVNEIINYLKEAN